MAAPKTLEHLTKARDCASFVAGDLQGALKTAGPVAALILLPLISKAAHLRHEIEQLATAVNEWGIDVPAAQRPDVAPSASSAGTPGPWRAVPSGSASAPDWIVIGGPDDRVVAGFPDVDPARVAADAQTIAAAPAVLAMVRAMIPACADSVLQRKARQLVDGLSGPEDVLVPLELLDGLAEYAEVYCTQNNEPADGACRREVREAYRIIHAARSAR